jgi:hypothetical protein
MTYADRADILTGGVLFWSQVTSESEFGDIFFLAPDEY